MKQNIPLGLCGIALFFIGLWGGSYLFSIVPDWGRFPSMLTGVVFGFGGIMMASFGFGGSL